MIPSDLFATDHAAAGKAAGQAEQTNTSRPARPEAPPGEEVIVNGETTATDDKEPEEAASSDENEGDQLPAKLVALIMVALSVGTVNVLSAMRTSHTDSGVARRPPLSVGHHHSRSRTPSHRTLLQIPCRFCVDWASIHPGQRCRRPPLG